MTSLTAFLNGFLHLLNVPGDSLRDMDSSHYSQWSCFCLLNISLSLWNSCVTGCVTWQSESSWMAQLLEPNARWFSKAWTWWLIIILQIRDPPSPLNKKELRTANSWPQRFHLTPHSYSQTCACTHEHMCAHARACTHRHTRTHTWPNFSMSTISIKSYPEDDPSSLKIPEKAEHI